MVEMYGAERRITLRLLAYWEKQRRDRPMPREQDINSRDLEDLWDNCFLIHVKDHRKPDYNFSYVGQSIVDACVFGLSPDEPSSLIAGYAKVAETCKPLIEEGEFINIQGEAVRYRQCLLPLGEGDKVLAIFGGMRFKIFPAE